MHTKTATDEIQYDLDWSKTGALVAGDTIATSVWAAPAGINLSADTIVGLKTKVFISGGTVDTKYVVDNTITTTPTGETIKRSLVIKVVPYLQAET